MTRPARPGDIGIIIADPPSTHKNIGKSVFVEGQCTCTAGHWRCKMLEPGWYNDSDRADAGDHVCFHKPNVIARENPDDKDIDDLQVQILEEHLAASIPAR